ncbi:hypothetical protein TSAR_014384 [Trichomalopsis sarcophagae]|uniref:Uncharacterized protein n=1 Tax=Trichomalopsis sarcophagae TaxID=543379 RepID=A0A232EEB3_9HYME|nr:hypothetical protein TSAR_014384 [Trichomalopsis sarcophagae]
MSFFNISCRTCITESTVLLSKVEVLSRWLDKRDITIARLRTSTNATKYRCHQILPMVFGLNNSYGKIVNIGLQNTSVGSDTSIRLFDWFRELFDEIDRFFQAFSEDDMLDQRITFSRFYIRFMISYSDRAFELLEDDETTIRKDSGESRSKKVSKPSLVFKRVTFDRLKALPKIIDHRIKYLLKVKEAITIIVKELGDYSKDKLVNSENAQFTYFTSYNVERATRDFDETLFRELFDEIDRFFQAFSEDDMLDQRITFSRFYIRFMISYSDRAFELLEDDETTIRKDSGESRSKKVHKPSLVLKRVTFDRLKALPKLIDHRIKYLLKVKEAITIIVKKLGDYSKDKLVNSENAQFTYFTSYNVERATRDFDETLL